MKRKSDVWTVCMLSVVIVLVMNLLLSCNTPHRPKTKQFEDGRVFVYEFTSAPFPDTEYIRDPNTMEAVTEAADSIVACRINKVNRVKYTYSTCLSFEYDVEILDIYLDVDHAIAVGDVIQVISSEGMMKAKDAAALFKKAEQAEALGILQPSFYREDEYMISSANDAIPIEVGKTYIMFLNFEYSNVYTECGRGYLYEYDRQTVYYRRRMFVSEQTTDEILSEIQAQIAKRSDRTEG